MSNYRALLYTKPGMHPNIDTQGESDYRGSGGSYGQYTGLGNPHHVVHVEWTWPTGDQVWTRVRMVRSTRSPATRVEEGITLFEVTSAERSTVRTNDRGNPVYEDTTPPSGEWACYAIFCLDEARVWKRAGYEWALVPENHGWAYRLPDLLPGIATGKDGLTADTPVQSNDLVQFLQPPSSYLDSVTTLTHSVGKFWDALACPPQSVPHMAFSTGYADVWSDGVETIGMGRMREVIHSLVTNPIGTMASISQFAQAVHGYIVRTEISNNLMLDVADSSFETNDQADVGNWTASGGATLLAKPLTDLVTVLLPPNVLFGRYLEVGSVTGSAVLLCGADDPTRSGIPIWNWSEARMSCYAKSDALGTIALGLDLYDYLGVYIRSVELVPATTLTADWQWIGTDGVNVPIHELERTITWPVQDGYAAFTFTQASILDQMPAPTDHTTFAELTFSGTTGTDGEIRYYADIDPLTEGAIYEVAITATTSRNVVSLVDSGWKSGTLTWSSPTATITSNTDTYLVGASSIQMTHTGTFDAYLYGNATSGSLVVAENEVWQFRANILGDAASLGNAVEMWVQFYLADGTTAVGSPISNVSQTSERYYLDSLLAASWLESGFTFTVPATAARAAVWISSTTGTSHTLLVDNVQMYRTDESRDVMWQAALLDANELIVSTPESSVMVPAPLLLADEDGMVTTTSLFRFTAPSEALSLAMQIFPNPNDNSWGTSADILLTDAYVYRRNSIPAYGVPKITVSENTDIDLVVVDDG